MQTKIMFLVVGLVAFITISSFGVFAYLEYNDIEEELGDKALSTATYIASSPVVQGAYASEDPSSVLQPYAERVRKQAGAEFVVLGDTEGIRYAHPDEWKIGESMVGGDNARALDQGQSYVSTATGTRGPSLRGKAPVRDEDGDIVGIVSVGFLLEDVRAAIWERFGLLFILALALLALGVIGSMAVSRNIRKDMFGLEPHEIGQLYQEKESVLTAIREGIIAIDTGGRITMMNESARNMLAINGVIEGQNIQHVLPGSEMPKVLKHGRPEYDQELMLRGAPYIVNQEPIIIDGQLVGVVSSFRDKSEMMQMANTLSDIQRYSDSLRSQNHEYLNKLYALSGYLHLRKYDEAVQLVEEETSQQRKTHSVVFQQIQDPTVQAILTGKAARASEKKTAFHIDSESRLGALPNHIQKVQLVSILGNLIDNAIDSAAGCPAPEVTFFVTEIEEEIMFEVVDSGPGLPEGVDITSQGASTKSGDQPRGYGLSIVERTINELEGMLEFGNNENQGAYFTVYLPKTLPQGGS